MWPCSRWGSGMGVGVVTREKGSGLTISSTEKPLDVCCSISWWYNFLNGLLLTAPCGWTHGCVCKARWRLCSNNVRLQRFMTCFLIKHVLHTISCVLCLAPERFHKYRAQTAGRVINGRSFAWNGIKEMGLQSYQNKLAKLIARCSRVNSLQRAWQFDPLVPPRDY